MFLRAWLKSQKVGAGFGYAAGCGAVASPRLSGQTYFRGFAPGSGFALCTGRFEQVYRQAELVRAKPGPGA